jgi:hypothetical protein
MLITHDRKRALRSRSGRVAAQTRVLAVKRTRGAGSPFCQLDR